MKIASVAQMRDMDRRAVQEFSLAEEILMENAGSAAFALLSRKLDVRGKRCAILCGTGNNGGDGLVVARLLHANGAHVRIFLIGQEGKFKGASKSNLEIIRKLSLKLSPADSTGAMKNTLLHSHIIVDALLGTGLDREVSGLFADLINLVNDSGKKILSLDIPSGVSGDTGYVMGTAVQADYTVTFGVPKIGNVLYPGYSRCGSLYVSHISFPPELYNREALKIETNQPMVLPVRPPTAHKGSVGKALFIAGSADYYGAPYFSSLSFLKAGGGYCYLATPKSVAPVLASKASEIVFSPQEETKTGSLALGSLPHLLELAAKTDLVVLGPGLSMAEETRQLIKELASLIDRPLLIDGDGLTALAENVDIIGKRKAPTVLTPHMGEMARLTGKSIDEINSLRIPVLQEAASRLQALIVLKGAHSLIGTPDGRVFVNLSGNPGMATAGSGDVLTGAIAGMFGLGLPLEEAVKKGVFIHGRAGDLAAARKGEDGIIASDIMAYLPRALKDDRENTGEGPPAMAGLKGLS